MTSLCRKIFMCLLLTGGCSNYANVPPNDIGMVLTPTGFEDQVYTPGQVNLKDKDSNGQGNSLVLIQRSGIEVKEQFIGKDGSEDKEDHRCLTKNGAPMTVDVRLLFALPDYETDQGKKDLARIFQLGNPQKVEDVGEGVKGRVLRITGESIYEEQAKQQVRGRIRQICSEYESFDEALKAFADTSTKGLTKRIEVAVAVSLTENNVPLRVVSALVSNMKPDPSVMDAISAKQAADKRVEAISTITKFLNEDPTGARWKVYKMQVLQELVQKGNANGHNTIYMTDLGDSSGKPTFQPSVILPEHP